MFLDKMRERERESSFNYNSINQGNGLELLHSLLANSVDLIFFDPQYEKVKQVLKLNYPLKFQSDDEIGGMLREAERVLKPSGFCLL